MAQNAQRKNRRLTLPVQKRDRPTSACRPRGPPTIRLTDATSGSDHVGMSRGKGSVTTHLPSSDALIAEGRHRPSDALGFALPGSRRRRPGGARRELGQCGEDVLNSCVTLWSASAGWDRTRTGTVPVGLPASDSAAGAPLALKDNEVRP
jgi:hypothetical protein